MLGLVLGWGWYRREYLRSLCRAGLSLLGALSKRMDTGLSLKTFLQGSSHMIEKTFQLSM